MIVLKRTSNWMGNGKEKKGPIQIWHGPLEGLIRPDNVPWIIFWTNPSD